MKTPPSAALFWFGLRDEGIYQIFYSQAITQRTIVDIFGARLSRKDRGFCPYNPWAK
jgi:hypothetical protein